MQSITSICDSTQSNFNLQIVAELIDDATSYYTRQIRKAGALTQECHNISALDATEFFKSVVEEEGIGVTHEDMEIFLAELNDNLEVRYEEICENPLAEHSDDEEIDKHEPNDSIMVHKDEKTFLGGTESITLDQNPLSNYFSETKGMNDSDIPRVILDLKNKTVSLSRFFETEKQRETPAYGNMFMHSLDTIKLDTSKEESREYLTHRTWDMNISGIKKSNEVPNMSSRKTEEFDSFVTDHITSTYINIEESKKVKKGNTVGKVDDEDEVAIEYGDPLSDSDSGDGAITERYTPKQPRISPPKDSFLEGKKTRDASPSCLISLEEGRNFSTPNALDLNQTLPNNRKDSESRHFDDEEESLFAGTAKAINLSLRLETGLESHQNNESLQMSPVHRLIFGEDQAEMSEFEDILGNEVEEERGKENGMRRLGHDNFSFSPKSKSVGIQLERQSPSNWASSFQGKDKVLMDTTGDELNLTFFGPLATSPATYSHKPSRSEIPHHKAKIMLSKKVQTNGSVDPQTDSLMFYTSEVRRLKENEFKYLDRIKELEDSQTRLQKRLEEVFSFGIDRSCESSRKTSLGEGQTISTPPRLFPGKIDLSYQCTPKKCVSEVTVGTPATVIKTSDLSGSDIETSMNLSSSQLRGPLDIDIDQLDGFYNFVNLNEPSQQLLRKCLFFMIQPHEFTKYVRIGSPHCRSFRLKTFLTQNDFAPPMHSQQILRGIAEAQIEWYAEGKAGKLHSIKLSEITHIVVGQETTIFRRNRKNSGAAALHFSVVYVDRNSKKEKTLDVSTNERQRFELWVVGLKTMKNLLLYKSWTAVDHCRNKTKEVLKYSYKSLFYRQFSDKVCQKCNNNLNVFFCQQCNMLYCQICERRAHKASRDEGSSLRLTKATTTKDQHRVFRCDGSS